jgi:Protein of unknown function (DUF732)
LFLRALRIIMQTLTAAMIVAFLASTHADHIDGTDSGLIAYAQGICIDMDDYGHNGAEVAQYLNEHSALDLAAFAKFVVDSVTYFCPSEYR